MAQLGACCNDQLGVVNDAVCFTISLEDTADAPIDIWTNSSTYTINGTIMVENNGMVGTTPTAELYVNGTAVADFVVAPGEARAITMEGIQSIGIVGAGAGTANVKVSFSLNYKF